MRQFLISIFAVCESILARVSFLCSLIWNVIKNLTGYTTGRCES